MLKSRVIERIAQVLYDANIEGLKSLGAPPDELSSEAVLIVADGIRSENNVLWDRTGVFDDELKKIIKDIFEQMFSPGGWTDDTERLDSVTSEIRRVLLEEHEAYLREIGRWKGQNA